MEKQMDNQANNVKEVIYTKAKVGRRLISHFFDLGILFLVVAIGFTICNSLIKKTNWYNSKKEELTVLRNESKLYDDGVVITSVSDDDTKLPSYELKKDYLSVRIEEFYHNSTYFKDLTIYEEYNSRKLDAKDGTLHLFIKDGDNIVENNVSHELLYNFYKSEVDEHALAYLMTNDEYFNLTRFSFWVTVWTIIILTVVFFTLFYLIFPLFIFRRGRQTIGMKLEKIALINVRAVNIPAWTYVLRFLFMLVIFIFLDFVAFLIPAFVSMGMMYGTKTNSSLVNYVFNDYMVDVTNQDIYLDEGEREFKEEERKKISLENRDLTLK